MCFREFVKFPNFLILRQACSINQIEIACFISNGEMYFMVNIELKYVMENVALQKIKGDAAF